MKKYYLSVVDKVLNDSLEYTGAVLIVENNRAIYITLKEIYKKCK